LYIGSADTDQVLRFGGSNVPPTAHLSIVPTLSINASGHWTAPEGLGIALNGSNDPGSDGLQSGITYTWSVTRNGAPWGTATGTNYRFVPDDNGTYVVTLTVTDGGGSGSTSQT